MSDSHVAGVRRSHVGRLAAMAVAAATVCVTVPVAIAPAAHAADPVTIQLLNINDFHGRIDENTTKFATTVEQLRAQHPESTLFLSDGDNIGASLFASSVQQDSPTLEVLNALGLDASGVGNHEFDQGLSDLTGRVTDTADFPYLGANVYEAGTTTPALGEYATFEVEGLTVGVVGVVTEETPTLVSPGGISTLDFGDPVEAVNRVAAQLSDGDDANGEADIIVAEFHEGAGAGTPDGSTLEEEVAAGGAFADIVNETSAEVDVIFTGHTHKQYAWSAEKPGGGTRPVLQTGSYGENIGQVTLSVDPETGDVVAHTQANVARVAAADTSIPAVADVAAIVDAALEHAAEVGNVPVGEVTADVTTAFSGGSYVDGVYTGGNRDDRASESTLGNLVANALRDGIPADMGTADLGIGNPGGLRNELYYAGNTAENPENTDGVVTYAEGNAVLPFVNNIWLVELTGADIVEILEQQWQTDDEGGVPSRPFLALGVSDNVDVTLDPSRPAGERVVEVLLDGEPLDEAATYTVSTFSFLAQGGDNFRAFANGTTSDTGLVDRDLWMSYLEDASPISPDFTRRQISASLPESVPAGDELSASLPQLNLTSLGAPEATTVQALLVGESGEPQVIGAVDVTNAAPTFTVTVPADAPVGDSVYLQVGDRLLGPVVVTEPPAPSTLVGPGTATGTYNQYTAIPVTVDTDGTGTGVVELRWGNYTHRAAVVDGQAVAALPRTFAPGTYRVGLYYSGDETTAPSSVGVVVTIQRARSTMLISAWPQPIPTGRTGTLGIEIGNSSGAPYSGWATVAYGNVGLRVWVHRGFARVTLPAQQTGWHRLTVWTEGTALIAPASAATSVPVRR